jgi:hypothetical protein
LRAGPWFLAHVPLGASFTPPSVFRAIRWDPCSFPLRSAHTCLFAVPPLDPFTSRTQQLLHYHNTTLGTPCCFPNIPCLLHVLIP